MVSFSGKELVGLSLETLSFCHGSSCSSHLCRTTINLSVYVTCEDEIRGSFLLGNFLGFLKWLFRRVVTKSSLPREDDWDAILNFDIGGKIFLAVSDFMLKRHFRTAALRVVKVSLDAQNERSKISGIQLMTSSWVNEFLTPYLESATNFLNFVCNSFLSHNFWKSDLVKGLTSFDYCFLFEWPRNSPHYAMVVCTTVLVFGDGCHKN